MAYSDPRGYGDLVQPGWKLVKKRTATHDGEVLQSADGTQFRRTGGEEVLTEAALERHLYEENYPVPAVIDEGIDRTGKYFFTEKSAGPTSLHDLAVHDGEQFGEVQKATIDKAVDISSRLLTAQIHTANPATTHDLEQWWDKVSFSSNVWEENPDLKTETVTELTQRAFQRLSSIPMALSHGDYGMPNTFEQAVIDWQHHVTAPVGFDVYPMFEIAAFKGGNRGYSFTPQQRTAYVQELDRVSERELGTSLSTHMGEFLLSKCFFFLALMRPPEDGSRPDKHIKWQYRRFLLQQGVEQYETTGNIDTGLFPTLATFTHTYTATGCA